MSYFSEIIIIYNPGSTGDGKLLAHELCHDIKARMPKQSIKVIPTKYAGHARKLAYTHAKASASPLIISASGDGGYHEVVNGVMQASREGAHPTSGILPAGNANDHYHSLHGADMVDAIEAHHTKKIDILKFSGMSNGKIIERYAHSYIGLGLTPKVGRELNKTSLNRVKETMIVLRVLSRLRPTRLKIDGHIRSYNSLVFSNIARMSKIFGLSRHASVTDGKFEITALRYGHKLKLIRSLVKASTVGFEGDRQAREFSFMTVKSTLVQLDGEVIRLDADTAATVAIEPRALSCIV